MAAVNAALMETLSVALKLMRILIHLLILIRTLADARYADHGVEPDVAQQVTAHIRRIERADEGGAERRRALHLEAGLSSDAHDAETQRLAGLEPDGLWRSSAHR